MTRIIVGLLLLVIASAIAHTQGNSQSSPPPNNTPPTFPQAPDSAGQIPPDTKAPPSEQLSAAEIQEQIQKRLDSEPALNNSELQATVDDTSVALTGTVQNEQQYALAIRIAQSYAGERRIVYNITIGGSVEQKHQATVLFWLQI
jgi:BON domain